VELSELHSVQRYEVKGGTENVYGKVNILLQTYISQIHIESFSLLSGKYQDIVLLRKVIITTLLSYCGVRILIPLFQIRCTVRRTVVGSSGQCSILQCTMDTQLLLPNFCHSARCSTTESGESLLQSTCIRKVFHSVQNSNGKIKNFAHIMHSSGQETLLSASST